MIGCFAMFLYSYNSVCYYVVPTGIWLLEAYMSVSLRLVDNYIRSFRRLLTVRDANFREIFSRWIHLISLKISLKLSPKISRTLYTVARIFREWVRAVDEFREIAQNNGHYAVQGHSRSPILVPVESTCATCYVWIIVTYVLSCTFPRHDDWWIISSNFRCRKGVPLFNAIVPAASPEFSVANLDIWTGRSVMATSMHRPRYRTVSMQHSLLPC